MCCGFFFFFFFFSSRRRHTRYIGDWSSDVCSSDLAERGRGAGPAAGRASARLSAARSPALGWIAQASTRSEERRVGKECRSRWWPDHSKKKRRETREE